MNAQVSKRIDEMSHTELVSLVKDLYNSAEYYSETKVTRLTSSYTKGFKDGKVALCNSIMGFIKEFSQEG